MEYILTGCRVKPCMALPDHTPPPPLTLLPPSEGPMFDTLLLLKRWQHFTDEKRVPSPYPFMWPLLHCIMCTGSSTEAP